MAEFADELALLGCLLLNALVWGSAYRFAIRRMTRAPMQAGLDAALIAYVVQYISVGVPGVVGALRPGTMAGVAILASLVLLIAAQGVGGKGRQPKENARKIQPDDAPAADEPTAPWSGWIVLAGSLFSIGLVWSLAHCQSILPAMGNDAMTYHLPAAVQWLQTGRTGLFQTWFFNPANTFSPLVGSTFITWLIAPFDGDVLARFVETPALLFVGLGAFQLMRQMKVEQGAAAIVAVGLIASRPFFLQSIMTKDDLFLTAFFVCAVVAMAPSRAAERLGAVRLGLAVGMLLAVKYTAILSLPILLLMIDAPATGRWGWRKWLAAMVTVCLLAGPWYARNLWMTGNPLFPVDVSLGGIHLLHGLFTPARSAALHSLAGVWKVLGGGDYGMPAALAVVVVVGWLATWSGQWRKLRRNALMRTCLLGPLVGLGLFLWRSPFPEVRFVLPSFVLLFAAIGAAIQFYLRPPWSRQIAALAVLALALFTAYKPDLRGQELNFLAGGLELMAAGLVVAFSTRKLRPQARLATIGLPALAAGLAFIYVFWSASLRAYEKSWFTEGSGWQLNYREPFGLWRFVNERLPRDAVVAYANLYLIYPLQGYSLDRRLIYAPTRPGIQTLADLPWLGDHISGEYLVPATVTATTADADRAVWMQNLRASRAGFLIVGKGGFIPAPPELNFIAAEPRRFQKLYENEAGAIYAIDWE